MPSAAKGFVLKASRERALGLFRGLNDLRVSCFTHFYFAHLSLNGK